MDITVHKVIVPVFIAVAAASASVIARGIAFNILHRWDRRAETRIGDIIVKAFRVPSIYWCIAIGLYAGIAISEMPDKYAFYFNKALHLIVILSVTVAAANLAGRIFRNYIQKSDLPVPTTGLAYGILKGSILVIGALVVLAALGISITPLITALGVGGLAVALALQDTLANLFAGIHILVEKSIRVGDFIRLESGQEGKVEDITWRTTRIKMAPNNTVVIPNNKLSQSVITNYSLPEKKMMLSISFSVSCAADPDLVEKILTDEAEKARAEVEGMLPDGGLSVRLTGFGENSMDFTISCPIREYSDQQAVQHEMRKRVLERFRNEGLDIFFPIRTVYVRGEKQRSSQA